MTGIARLMRLEFLAVLWKEHARISKIIEGHPRRDRDAEELEMLKERLETAANSLK